MQERKYNRLAEVLKEKKWSQQDLADKLDVSQQAIQKICSNKSQMSMQRLFLVAEILDVDVCDLLVRNKELKD